MIIVAVGYYLRYNLSYRDVQEILYDRGINVFTPPSTAGYRNMENYFTLFGKRKINNPSIRGRWMETYIKIKGKWHYLYRAIDADGLTLDIWLRKTGHTSSLCFS